MVATSSDAKVNFVLSQIKAMVATEGGSLELVSSDATSVKVRYIPGVNRECPECVPTLDHVRHFLGASMKIHAPHIAKIEVS